MKEGIKYIAIWTIERIEKATGKVLDSEIIKNTVVNTGLERAAKLLNGMSVTPFTYIAVGTGALPAGVGDLALGNETTRALATATYVASGFKSVLTYTFSFGGVYAITEAGCFDQLVVPGSVMFNRSVFVAKNVDTTITLKVTVNISHS